MSILADAISETSLTLPPRSDSGAIALKSVVHEQIVVANPLDYQLFDWGDREGLRSTYEAFMNEGFNLAISVLEFPREDRCDTSDWEGVEEAIITAARNPKYPAAVMSTLSGNLAETLALRLLDHGIAPLSGIQAANPAVEAAAPDRPALGPQGARAVNSVRWPQNRCWRCPVKPDSPSRSHSSCYSYVGDGSQCFDREHGFRKRRLWLPDVPAPRYIAGGAHRDHLYRVDLLGLPRQSACG